MGNEMGNRNINGLQVSEQESNEATEVINQSPNASFVSNDLDGLKGVTGYLTDSSQKTEKLATGGFLAPSVVLNVAEDPSQLISSREYEEKQDTRKFATNESLIPSVVSNDAEDVSQLISSREYEASEEQDTMKLATDKSLNSSVVSNEEHTDSAHNESLETDVSLLQKQKSERRVSEEASDEASKATNESPKASVVLTDVHGLKASEKHDAEMTGVSNDADDSSHLILSREFEDLHDKHANSAHNESLETDETMIQKQAPEEREEEEARTWVQGSNEKGDELEDETVERPNECVSPDTNPKFMNYTRDLPVEDSGSCGEMVLMDREVAEGYIDQDGERQCAELDLIGQDFTSLKWKNDGSNEPVNAAYLDAIDFEIKRLLMEDDPNEVSEASNTEPNGCESPKYGKETSEEVLKMDDIENDGFDIQLKAINPCEEEKEEREAGGLEDAVFELAIPTDYNPSLMSEKCNKDSEGETKRVEMETSTSQIGISVADNEHEEKMECGREDLEKNEIVGERFSELSSSLPDDVVIARDKTVMETEDLNAEEIVTLSKGSDSETKHLQSNEINADVGEEMEKKIENLNANAEERSEQPDGELDGQMKVVADATMSDECKDQMNSVDTTAIISPQFFQEFGQKHTTMESEALENKEELFTIDVSEGLGIIPWLPNLTDRTFLAAFESENEKQLHDDIDPSLNQMTTKNKEQECIPMDHSGVNVTTTDPKALEGSGSFTPMDHSGVCVTTTDAKALEGSGSFTTEPNQENFKAKTHDTPIESVKCLIYAFERSDLEAEENSLSYISDLEFVTEETKHNPSLGHEKYKEGDAFALGVSEGDENIREYHISTNQEVISKIGEETAVSVFESTNEESDKSPLLCRKKLEESGVSAVESESGKLRTPLLNLLKEEVSVVEKVEKKEGLVLKKTVEELWRSPTKKSMAISPRGREKQKPRSSLFSNCMCCTTAIN